MTSHIKVPQGGQKIVPGQAIPNNPIIPFIEGDGIGIDITPVMIKVVDAAVSQGLRRQPRRSTGWKSSPAKNRPVSMVPDEWFPQETFDALKEYSVSIKGPMTTPVGGGIRSLNVACARNSISTSACVRCSTSRACRRR
jgi:isocitrate dehydrogenase